MQMVVGGSCYYLTSLVCGHRRNLRISVSISIGFHGRVIQVTESLRNLFTLLRSITLLRLVGISINEL